MAAYATAPPIDKGLSPESDYLTEGKGPTNRLQSSNTRPRDRTPKQLFATELRTTCRTRFL